MIFYALILAIILLTILSGFFSCSETAFFSLPASKVRGYRSSQDPKKRQVANILARSKSLLVTIFMYNTIVNVLLQNASSSLFAESNAGWILQVGFPLVLILFVGELAPKYYGLIHNEKLALLFSSLIEWCEWIITPFRIAITRISYILSRLFFFYLKSEPGLSKDELAHILQSSEGKGILHQNEVQLIHAVLDLEDKQIKELMRQRAEMPIYSPEEPISKLVHLFSEERHQEVALFEMPQEKMLGTLNVRDFFMRRQEITEGKDLVKIAKKPFYVPETTSASAVLQQLSTQATDTAWIVDEYGASCGVITEIELLNHVAGFSPSHEPEKKEFERLSKDAVVANGTLTLDKVEELFGIALKSQYHMLTIGGYITEKLGTIPKSGAILEQEGLFMRVLSSDDTHIRKVYIQKREVKP